MPEWCDDRRLRPWQGRVRHELSFGSAGVQAGDDAKPVRASAGEAAVLGARGCDDNYSDDALQGVVASAFQASTAGSTVTRCNWLSLEH